MDTPADTSADTPVNTPANTPAANQDNEPPEAVTNSALESVEEITERLAPELRSTVSMSLSKSGNGWMLEVSWNGMDGTRKTMLLEIDNQGNPGRVRGKIPYNDSVDAQKEREEAEKEEAERQKETEEGQIHRG